MTTSSANSNNSNSNSSNSSGSNRKVVLKKGEVLIHEGTKGNNFFWLQEGALGVYKRCNNYRKHIGDIYKGELVGEMAFLDREARSATVVAMSDCELIEIPGAKFDEIFSSLPTWYQALIKTMLARLRRANNKLALYASELEEKSNNNGGTNGNNKGGEDAPSAVKSESNSSSDTSVNTSVDASEDTPVPSLAHPYEQKSSK
ncbi:MAG: Crp/Fnr family transcriptional regulator [Oligoflexia bacterium]|nr:Crp/Fnr family transcriptional regulator [Oligoflexia bacterium]